MGDPMIRNATPLDVDRLVELGTLMHAESPRFKGFAYQPEKVATMIEWLMGSETGLVLVAEHDGEVVGGIMAMAMPHYACDLVQASDLAFFVHPEYRGGATALRLVRGYLAWAKDAGAEPSIGLNTGVAPERTELLLAALGAEQSGTIWTWG
jgi:predicted N-acetyltransferase YhbS